MKTFGVIVIVIIKLLAIVVMLVLFCGLQSRFGIGIAMLGLLHVAAVVALVMYRVRGRNRREPQALLGDRTTRSTV